MVAPAVRKVAAAVDTPAPRVVAPAPRVVAPAVQELDVPHQQVGPSPRALRPVTILQDVLRRLGQRFGAIVGGVRQDQALRPILTPALVPPHGPLRPTPILQDVLDVGQDRRTGPLVSIQNMTVRSEEDIEKISRQLHRHIQTQTRARGGRR